eukprot:15358654-Ditylum_brightwellii.AAC.4
MVEKRDAIVKFQVPIAGEYQADFAVYHGFPQGFDSYGVLDHMYQSQDVFPTYAGRMYVDFWSSIPVF